MARMKKATTRRGTNGRRTPNAKRTPSRKTAVRARSPKSRMTTRKSIGEGARRSGRAPEVGGMTVREAGRKGGLIGGKKGGETVKRERGVQFYKEIGRKGGQRVRDLIAAGKKATERPARRRST